jgi:selenocysteine lyase/cysteine desulfurase
MKKYYQHFINAHPKRLHFAGHSHHYWPDISREAQLDYWDLSAKLVDHKWDLILGEHFELSQKIIAQMIGINKYQRITIASNTHELITRLIFTLLEKKSPLHILTSDSEFHSFTRQINRLESSGLVSVTRIKCNNENEFENFAVNICNELKKNSFDLLFFSHCFFNTGFILEDEAINQILELAIKQNVTTCVDLYHSFATKSFNFSPYEKDIFFTAGGYKYAQAGEGICWMSVPELDLTPVHTGWFAAMANLESNTENFMPELGKAWLGATMDFSALFRFNKIWTFFAQEKISINDIHKQVKKMQAYFIQKLHQQYHPILTPKNLVTQNLEQCGHFLTFKLGTTELAKKIHQELAHQDVLTDYRDNCLRFGFSAHIDNSDIDQLFTRLKL